MQPVPTDLVSDDLLADAFPTRLRHDVKAVAAIMPASRLRPAGAFTVQVDAEPVTIPYRLYNPEPPDDLLAPLSPTQLNVFHLLYIRHHDGKVRQRHLEHIIQSEQPWVVPFVVQLVGEYVVEILLVIRDRLVDIDVAGTAQHDAYGRFIATNPEFFYRTRQRTASYWNCYHRGRYADRRHYPGLTILSSLANAARSQRVQPN